MMPTTLASPHSRRDSHRQAGTPAAAHLLLTLLSRIERGRIELHMPDGRVQRFGPGGSAADGVRAQPAVLQVADWRTARTALASGDVGFAESYMAGHWTTPDLVQLLTVLAANQPVLERAFYGHAWARGLLRLRHWLNANTRRQARRNIAAHYDLGNDFYALWLDRTMTYSSAIFEGASDRSLDHAQQAKYDRLLA